MDLINKINSTTKDFRGDRIILKQRLIEDIGSYSLTSDLQMTQDFPGIVSINNINTTYSLKLPNAQTLFNGWKIRILNNDSTNTLTVKYYSETNAFTINSGSIIEYTFISLANSSDTDGIWKQITVNGSTTWNTITGDITANTDLMNNIPIGRIMIWSGQSNTIPTGWLLCDGSAISRTTYSNLYSVIGTAFGVGDGSTTFNIPNFQGRFILGADATYAFASIGGEATHTLSIDEIPAHNHSTIALTPYLHSGSIHSGDEYGISSGTTESTGGGQAHNNMPPYIAIKFLIKY